MANKKKSVRRVPRASEPRMFGDGAPSQANQQERVSQPAALGTRSSTAAAPRTAVSAGRVPVTVTQDYGYVAKDLRRLGMLSAGIFGVLVVLSLVVR